MEENNNIQTSESITNKKNKLKNKKKDIILADNLQEKSLNPYSSANDNNKKKEINKEEKKPLNPLLAEDNKVKNPDEEIINTEKKAEKKATKSEKNSTNSDAEKTAKNSKAINDVIFNIQLLFSSSKIVPLKIYQIFLKYLSMENLKEILEERDCLEICGNIQCNNSLEKKTSKKFYFDSKVKEFVKDDVLNYFCDIKCMQKFKDAMKITDTFDFLKFFKLENLYILHNAKDYFSDEIFLKKISFLIRDLYEGSIKKVDEETIKALRKNLDKCFIDYEKDKVDDNFNEINGEFKEKIDIN